LRSTSIPIPGVLRRATGSVHGPGPSRTAEGTVEGAVPGDSWPTFGESGPLLAPRPADAAASA